MYTDEPSELSVCPWWELADMHTHHASSTQRPIQRLIPVLPLDNFVGLWGQAVEEPRLPSTAITDV